MKTENNETTVHEVEIHYKRPLVDSMTSIKDSKSASQAVRDFANEETLDHKEFFWAMYLTPMNKILAICELSKGSTMGTVVNIKEIVQLALRLNASNVLICHNHPSGNLCFSKADIALTKKIKKAVETMDMTLLDHIIITSEGYSSYEDEDIG